MVSIASIQAQLNSPKPDAASGGRVEYEVVTPLNLYDSPDVQELATQAIAQRHLYIATEASALDLDSAVAIPVVLCEDDYPAWLAIADLDALRVASNQYIPTVLDANTIQPRIPAILDFARAAMAEPNLYLWGGTLGPNFDCSGLVQRSFESQGIWLPRDAYQQEAFIEPIQNPGSTPADFLPVLHPGDLLFFGTPQKANHVAIYLGNGTYIHSSGKQQGRNGIGLDRLDDLSHPVSQTYYEQVRGAGRVTQSYCAGSNVSGLKT